MRTPTIDQVLPTALAELYKIPHCDWTKGVKTALCEIAPRIVEKQPTQQVRCYASGVDSGVVHGPEWLFDVTCLVEEFPEYNGIKRIALVAECEWGSWNDVVHDFQNLIITAAEIRLMVFDLRRLMKTRALSREYRTMERVVLELSAIAGDCEDVRAGDLFVYAGWISDGFTYRSVRFNREMDGDHRPYR